MTTENGKVKDHGNDKAKKAAAAALAAAVAAGAAGLADTPPTYDDINVQAAIVQDIGDVPMDMPADQIDDQDTERQKKRVSIGKIIMAPLYIIGYGLMKLLEFLIGGVASPILAFLLKWVLLSAVVLGALAAGLKYAFPDVPLGKLLTPKRIAATVGGVALVNIICQILPIFGTAAAVWASRIEAVGGGAILAATAFFVFRIRSRKKKKLVVEDALEVE